MLKKNQPLSVVILGATGDLAKRKLFPALYRLYAQGLLPSTFSIVAFSRRPWKDSDFQIFISEALSSIRSVNKNKLKNFLKHVIYHEGLLNTYENFRTLGEKLKNLDDEGISRNKLYFLAISPDFYKEVFNYLGRMKLEIKRLGTWQRILIEKPFGADLRSAQTLDRALSWYFSKPEQFILDHYLAKRSVEHIPHFRLAHSKLKKLWNGNFIENVSIKLLESHTAEHRAGFYDKTGALRDVGQNHVLQLLATTLMDLPKQIDSLATPRARARILNAITLPPTNHGSSSKIIRGQYEGYRDGLDNNSVTETYFNIEAVLKLQEWKGVVVNFESGKALKNSLVESVVTFKKSKLFPRGGFVRFVIQPNARVEVSNSIVQSGAFGTLQNKYKADHYLPKTLDRIDDAYEQLFADAIVGDHSRFPSIQEIYASWKFIGSIKKICDASTPVVYPKGSYPIQKKPSML